MPPSSSTEGCPSAETPASPGKNSEAALAAADTREVPVFGIHQSS